MTIISQIRHQKTESHALAKDSLYRKLFETELFNASYSTHSANKDAVLE